MLCIYHRNCADGFTAAWCAKLAGVTDFHASQYGEAPPDVDGLDVVVVDFSYPRDVLFAMKERARSIYVLDHHKSARAALEGLDFCLFDMERSGAAMTWDYFFPDLARKRPLLVDYVQDRDLWQWRLPSSREVNAVIGSYEQTFENWDRLGGLDVREMHAEGAAILRYQDKLADQIAANAEEVEIDGHLVLVSNSGVLQSEVGERLAKGRPFGVVWFEREGEIVLSLRSRAGGIDVSELARKFGGGGHAGAAGMRVASGTRFGYCVDLEVQKIKTENERRADG